MTLSRLECGGQGPDAQAWMELIRPLGHPPARRLPPFASSGVNRDPGSRSAVPECQSLITRHWEAEANQNNGV